MIFKDRLNCILNGEHLTEQLAGGLMDQIMDGELTEVQTAGLLIALRQKGETAQEVAGFANSMRAHAISLEVHDSLAVDSVGTGGDGAGTFNISTAAGIVAAGAGVTVAKHGNRSISSKCGSADLLEATGGNIDPGPEIVKRCIDAVNFGFMFAPRFHPAMKHAIGPRRQLGVRTVFNILGPLTNPAGVKRIVLGVFQRELLDLVADVLSLLSVDHVMIVHSDDGLDEFSISSSTTVVELKGGTRSEFQVKPQDAGLETYPATAVAGGDASENLGILKRVLEGEPSGYRDVVLLNAAALMVVGDKASDLREGARLAAEAIDNGSARQVLHDWAAMSNGQ